MIIKSILDTDLYKLTMQRAVLFLLSDWGFKTIPTRFVFSNRRKEGKFTPAFVKILSDEIVAMQTLALTNDEARWLSLTCPYLTDDYIEYLRNFRFDPSEVSVGLTDDNELTLEINGSWERTILWEVPLMALISELYFIHCDTDWSFNEPLIAHEAHQKGRMMTSAGAHFSDFGTRRRRSFQVQAIVDSCLSNYRNVFGGTSNVCLAHRLGLKPIGTMAHEWVMGISALEGLRHANRQALYKWNDVYKGRLGIALPDTFGTGAFWGDFDAQLARMYDGVRHDSGDPFVFGERLIDHYKSLGMRPISKALVPSDGLDIDLAIKINDAFGKQIFTTAGIGTHLTNDFEKMSVPGEVSKALNMVIKMDRCNGVPVVKLSDIPSKAIGDADARRVAMWTFFNKPLDEK